MVLEVKPPQRAVSTSIGSGVFDSIFLAGSIEMGKAEPWRHKIVKILEQCKANCVVYNPRRDDWDSTWDQSFTNPNFYQQVSWEMDCLNSADFTIFYIDPKTKSPITLLELGMMKDDDIVVCCPDGYWRKGNVEMFCERHGIRLLDTFEQLETFIKSKYQNNEF